MILFVAISSRFALYSYLILFWWLLLHYAHSFSLCFHPSLSLRLSFFSFLVSYPSMFQFSTIQFSIRQSTNDDGQPNQLTMQHGFPFSSLSLPCISASLHDSSIVYSTTPPCTVLIDPDDRECSRCYLSRLYFIPRPLNFVYIVFLFQGIK